jgi:NAD(P)-dependent dehydrogenase (short-subunit alcohol dehydrogenase family)
MSNKKKILVIGAFGNIGKYVAEVLSKKHEVIKAARKSGDINIDITSVDSIKEAYKKLGKLDAVVSCAGETFFGDFETVTEEQFYKGIKSKMMGQINLVLIGKDYISENGSFTLTTGILSEDPVKGSVNSTTVNNAVHGFVLSASKELKKGLRINAVCPGLVEVSAEKLGAYFPGHVPVPMNRVVQGYVKSVDGICTGEVIKIY